MLSLSLFSKTSYRPRLGRKPAGRRLSSLALGGCIAALVLTMNFADKQQLLTVVFQNEETKMLKSVQNTAMSTETQTQDELQLPIQETLQKNNKFRVQMVSYDQIRQKQLQTRLATFQQRQQEIEKSQKSLQVISQEQDTSAYLSGVERKIELAGNRRWITSGKRLVGEAKVLIEITHNGEIDHLELVTSSGNTLVDNELLASVREAAPFARAPLSLRQPGKTSISLTRWLRFVIENNRKK